MGLFILYNYSNNSARVVLTSEEFAVLAAGNSEENTAYLEVIQRDSNNSLHFDHPSGSRLSGYCSSDHQSRCRELLVLRNSLPNATTRTQQDLALVPLENGVWILDLRRELEDSEMVLHGNHTLSDSSCQTTLGIFNTSSGASLFCVHSAQRLLYSCQIRLEMNISESYLECAQEPLPIENLSSISNIITVGMNIESMRQYFYIVRSLHSFRVGTESFVSHESASLPASCDHVSLVKSTTNDSNVFVYCNDNEVYLLNLSTETLSLVGNGSLYYPCRNGSYHLDREAEQVIYNLDRRSISFSTSNFVSGVCFDEDKLVYLDRVRGGFLLRPSAMSSKSLNTAGCVNRSCDIPLVFFEWYVLIRGNGRLTLIDSRKDNATIIAVDGVPTTLVTVISLPTTPPPPPPPSSPPISTAPTSTSTDPTPSQMLYLLSILFIPVSAGIIGIIILLLCLWWRK